MTTTDIHTSKNVSPLSAAADRHDAQVETVIDDTLRRKIERRGVVTHVPVDLDAFGARLSAFFGSRIDGTFEIHDLRRLPGGASKEQFVFDLDWTDGGRTRHEKLVLRMDPPASMVETPRIREFEMLHALSGVLPVPEVLWMTDDPSELGGPAMVCGFLTGVTSPADAPKTASGLGCTFGPALRPGLGEQFVRHLAALHRFDWSTSDLGSFDPPTAGTTEAVDARLALWDRAWAEDSYAPHPAVTLARRWLWEHRPVVDHVSVVHGDYRNGNFLFDESTGKITAVLDWELTYLGDRHHDLAYAMMLGWGEIDSSTGDFYCSALIRKDEFIELYQQVSGLEVDPVRLEYYTVMNLYWAVVALIGTGPRNAAEKMTHLDVMQNFLSGLGAQFLEQMLDIVAPRSNS